MTKEASQFRLQAKRVFLTYPNCGLSKQVLFEELNKKLELQYARICIEAHQSGEPHLHAVVLFKKKCHTRLSNFFDVEGHHPNIQKVTNWPASLNYVKKGDDWDDFGSEEDEDEIEDDLSSLADTLPKKEYFKYCLKKKVPFAYADQAWRERASMFTITESGSSGTIRPDLDAYRIDAEDRRSHLIIGPSGIGKTTWALREANKPALLVTHMDTLKSVTKDHKSIIFDDMSFIHIPREAQIQLVDRDLPRSIHVRYGTANIPAGIQKIFTANVPIFDTSDEAIRRRVNTVHFLQPTFLTPQ